MMVMMMPFNESLCEGQEEEVVVNVFQCWAESQGESESVDARVCLLYVRSLFLGRTFRCFPLHMPRPFIRLSNSSEDIIAAAATSTYGCYLN